MYVYSDQILWFNTLIIPFYTPLFIGPLISVLSIICYKPSLAKFPSWLDPTLCLDETCGPAAEYSLRKTRPIQDMWEHLTLNISLVIHSPLLSEKTALKLSS